MSGAIAISPAPLAGNHYRSRCGAVVLRRSVASSRSFLSGGASPRAGKAPGCDRHRWNGTLQNKRPANHGRGGLKCSASFSLFPSGQKQAKVKLPALLLETTAAEVLRSDGEAMRVIEEAVLGGATGVVLRDSDGQAGGAELYDAACRVRDLLRGRAVLLVVDRTDIADAAEADGVLLTQSGVPIAVARRMLSGAGSLVGSLVNTPAESAQAAEAGANLVVLQGTAAGGPTVAELENAVKGQKAGSIPVIGGIRGEGGTARELLSCPSASGLCLSTQLLMRCGEAVTERGTVFNALDAAAALLDAMGGESLEESQLEDGEDATASASDMRKLLSLAREDLVVEEKTLLQDILTLLQEVSPAIEEIDLLEDALVGLDELFLLVVVGEFNSGKSTFINALLGEKFLAEGILPTTNEISVLRHTDGEARVEQDADGMYQRYLPADLLTELNIVDTPGTNVVLERQQRLTEEYIPRADLVLFVMSADRPFTESEVKFLKYIRQWGKKIVFILNKADLLQEAEQVEQVRTFVSNNVLEILGVDNPKVIPLSSRRALQAKLDAGSGSTGGILSSIDDQQLAVSPTWGASGFADLETFLLGFLVGSEPGKASESVRLKLQTPLSIADALLGASQQQLKGDLASAEKDLEALLMVEQQLGAFRADMERDSGVQQERIQKLVRGAAAKTEELVDRELQLSSGNLTSYMFSGAGDTRPQDMPVASGFRAEISGIANEVQKLVREHTRWIMGNTKRQMDSYRSFSASRAEALGIQLTELPFADETTMAQAAESDAVEVVQQDRDETGLAVVSVAPLSVVEELELSSVGLLLNEEVKESFTVTGGAVAGAGVFGVVLTTILPTTWEDLLACAVAGLIGYLAILNLPLRRAETKAKVKRVAANFANELSTAMNSELASALDGTDETIMGWIRPLVEAARKEVEMVRDAEARRAALSTRLEETREKASNVS